MAGAPRPRLGQRIKSTAKSPVRAWRRFAHARDRLDARARGFSWADLPHNMSERRAAKRRSAQRPSFGPADMPEAKFDQPVEPEVSQAPQPGPSPVDEPTVEQPTVDEPAVSDPGPTFEPIFQGVGYDESGRPRPIFSDVSERAQDAPATDVPAPDAPSHDEPEVAERSIQHPSGW